MIRYDIHPRTSMINKLCGYLGFRKAHIFGAEEELAVEVGDVDGVWVWKAFIRICIEYIFWVVIVMRKGSCGGEPNWIMTRHPFLACSLLSNDKACNIKSRKRGQELNNNFSICFFNLKRNQDRFQDNNAKIWLYILMMRHNWQFDCRYSWWGVTGDNWYSLKPQKNNTHSLLLVIQMKIKREMNDIQVISFRHSSDAWLLFKMNQADWQFK